jgi:hypothetical protein
MVPYNQLVSLIPRKTPFWYSVSLVLTGCHSEESFRGGTTKNLIVTLRFFVSLL